MRDYKLYLEDILRSIQRIEKYVRGLTYRQFQKDQMLLDDIVSNKIPTLKKAIAGSLDKKK